MKKTLFLLAIITSFFTTNTNAALIPATVPDHPVRMIYPTDFSKISIKNIQQLIGRKLTLKEKLSLKLLQWKMKYSHGKKVDNSSSLGRTAFMLGLASLILLLIPYLGILSIPAAIAAIITGSKAKRENPGDTKAKTGIILGIITLGLIILAIVFVIVLLSIFIPL